MDIINRLEEIQMQLRGLSGICSVMADAILEGPNIPDKGCGNGLWLIASVLDKHQKNMEEVIDVLHQQNREGAA
ncbi:hypothetical protein [Anaerotruncus colihominis]|uniref:Uncharacterized protein n=1 Tax=Anaerotruncus colihominis DSM 17241 TaxID=445972 RepID=B0PAR0_9FIRM|nr:hypothetical protein [Anaerotruncus colihominis]EDS11240.1 hypothetical protein ANACOL_01860 [Anaerotruncus colihominis DSM 17241]UWN76561.1 hypothetical protein NQ528_08380 [Anaerotruncus colihominis]DAO20913.1 MAG TPA: Methyltransferase domain [Caudoviricetes sp.]